MRTINVRFMGILLAAVTVLLIVVITAHHFQVKHMAGMYIRDARAAKEKSDAALKRAKEADKAGKIDQSKQDFEEAKEQYNTATRNYSTYCRLQPNDLKALGDYAFLLRDKDRGNWKVAFTKMEDLLRKDPDDHDTRRALVDLAIFLGDIVQRDARVSAADRAASTSQWFSVARDHLRDYLLKDLPDDAEWLDQLGRCHDALGEDVAAEQAFQKSIENDPNRWKAYWELALLLRESMRRPKPADALIEKMLAANPDSFGAQLAAARYYSTRNEGTDEAADYPANAFDHSLTAERLAEQVKALPLSDKQLKALRLTEDQLKVLWLTKDQREKLRLSDEQTKLLEAAEAEAGQAALTGYELKELGLTEDQFQAMRVTKDQRATLRLTPDQQKAIQLTEQQREALRLAEAEGPLDSLRLLISNPVAIGRLKDTQSGSLLLAAQAFREKASRILEEHPREGFEEAMELINRARECARQGIDSYPDAATSFYEILADIETRSGNRDLGIEVLREGLRATKNDPRLLWVLATSLIDNARPDDKDKLEQVAKVTADLEKKDQDFPQYLISYRAAYLRARLRLAASDWHEALQGFEKARSGLGMVPQVVKQIDFWIGRCYLALRNADQEQAAYRRALSVDPNYFMAADALVDSLLASGKADDALTVYQGILRNRRLSAPGLVRLARILIAQNLRRDKDQRTWEPVERALDEAAKLAPDSPDVPLLRATVLDAQERKEDAEKVLQTAYARQPSNMRFLDSQVALALRQLDWDKAQKLLDDAQQKLGDTTELRLARARYLAQRHAQEEQTPEQAREKDKAVQEQFRQLVAGADKLPEAECMQLLGGVMQAALHAGSNALARDLARQIAERDPHNVQIRFLQFELALRVQDKPGMEKSLEDLRTVEGQGPLWHFCKATQLSVLASEDKEKSPALLDEALRHVAQTREARPSWSRVPWLTGALYDQSGKPDLAMEQYRRAIELGDRSPGTIRRLVNLYIERRMGDKAQEVLRMAAQSTGEIEEDDPLFPLLVRVQALQGNQLPLLKRVRDSVAESKESKDHLFHGQLAEACARQANNDGRKEEAAKLLEEAEKAFRRAIELDKTSDKNWVALVKFLAGSGQTLKAEDALQEAIKILPPETSPAALAQCYDAVGQRDKAMAKYEEALAAAPKSAETAQRAAEFYWRSEKPDLAEAQAKRIVEGKVDADPLEMSWARRLLALVLVSRTGYPNFMKALELIDQNLASPTTASLPDRRLKASILASLPTKERHEEAVKIYEDLVNRPDSVNSDDQFILAKLYLTEGAYTKFLARMQKLMSANPNRSAYLATFVQAQIDHNELSDAETNLARLEQIAPEEFNTVALRAELAFRRGQYEQALEMLTSFIDKTGARPPDRMTRLRLVAETLENMSRRMTSSEAQLLAPRFARETEMVVRQYVDQNPGQEMAMVTFLIRQGQLNEALDTLQRIWEKAHPVLIAQALVALQNAPNVSQEQMKRGEGILYSALKTFDRSTPLLLVMAHLSTGRERYDEAETYYREVLGKDKTNAVAMNNLAMLLALQRKKLDEALSLVDRAIQLSGPIGSMLDSRAVVYMANKQPEKAVADMVEAVEDSPLPVRLFHLAQAYQQAGQQAKAAEAFSKAQKGGLKPHDLHPLERIAYQQMLDSANK